MKDKPLIAEGKDFLSLATGISIIILAICLGFGGCWYMCSSGEAARASARHNVISTNSNFP